MVRSEHWVKERSRCKGLPRRLTDKCENKMKKMAGEIKHQYGVLNLKGL